MTAPPKRSRGYSLHLAVPAVLLTLAAYCGGMYVRQLGEPAASLEEARKTRLAQVGNPLVPPSRTSTARAKNPEADKRLRAARETFAQVHDLVRSEFVDQIPSQQVMTHGAIRAMLSSLQDEQSYFVTTEERSRLEAETEGRFEGMGAITAIRGVKTRAGYTELRLLVVAPFPDSPAMKAGLKTGDHITHLNGRYILGDNPYLTPSKLQKQNPKPATGEEIVDDEDTPIQDGVGLLVAQMQLRKGVSGSQVLTVQRAGVAKPLRMVIRNAPMTAPKLVVRREKSGGKSATYLRVAAFTAEVGMGIANLLDEAPSEESVVLDLRQNSGSGSIEIAERIAANLSSSAEPFAIEIGVGGKRTVLPIPTKDLARIKRKVSVLTDGGTAGIAEALAIRLADTGATIIGTGRTWGDGRSQTMYPLPDDSAFTLTTGRLISPKGTAWELVGLAPRVILPGGLDEVETVARAVAVAGRTGSASIATSQEGVL